MAVNAMVKTFTVLLAIVSGVLCSGTQQGVSGTQTGQTLQIQPNVRKYNKHTSTEKPCTTAGSTTGTRNKDKPDVNSDGGAQDYAVPIGGAGPAAAYPYPPYPYPYPYQPVGPYRVQYPYEQYPVDPAAPPPPPYYAPYYYPGAPAAPLQQQYLPPATPYPAAPYPAAPYPAAPPSPYEQAVVVDAYRLPGGDQSQYFRQPAAPPPPQYYFNGPPPPPHFRAHAYGRPHSPPQPQPQAFLQQREAPAASSASPAANGNASAAEPQYEQQQQSGSFDGNQYHF